MVTKLCLVGAGSIGRRHLKLLLEREDVALCVAEPSEKCKAAVKEICADLPIYDSMAEAVKANPEENASWERLKEVFRSPSLQMVSFTITSLT